LRKVLLLASLSMVLALVLSAPAMAQSASASASADSCVPNGEGGEACSGLSTEEASELAAQGYSCDQTDNGAYCEGVPVSSPSADPCPDPNFPRETPDGCQASDLPDVSFGDDASPTASPTASATASASASASASVSVLPETGGPVSVMALVPLVLLLGTGILALRIVRRS
jgi:hypothetical protein